MSRHDTELVRRELIRTADSMLRGDLDLILGSRVIFRLRFDTGIDPNDPVFHQVMAVHSDTLHFPAPDERARVDPAYLEELDAEAQAYAHAVRSELRQALVRLIARMQSSELG